MKKLVRNLAFMTCLATISGCGPFQSPAVQYVERSDTLTLSAGNDQGVNAVNGIVDPWPPGVGDRRIPVNGERMVGAIARYRGTTAQRPGGQSGQATPASTSSPPPNASDATLPF